MPTEMISKTEFARRMGVSRQAVYNAIDKKRLTLMPMDNGVLMLAWPDCREEWIKRGNPLKMGEHFKEELPAEPEEDAPSGESWADAKCRKDVAAANLAELELAKRKGDLLDRTLVERQSFEAGRRVRDAIRNVPNRIADQLAVEMDRFKIHRLLTEELDKALEELAVQKWDEVENVLPPEEDEAE